MTAMSGNFEYSNLNSREPSRFLRVACKLLPGVDRVEGQIAPYAASWHEHNLTVLAGDDPVWVVLGDSISQGIGATSIEQSWVLQAWRALAARGLRYRVVNLSISGATVTDVIDREIPAMHELATSPSVVTVFIGSNDIVHRELRAKLPANYQKLIAALPRGSFVAVTGRDHGALGEIDRIVQAAAATGDVVEVPVRIAAHQRAEDHFHPNDDAYALIAADFTAAIAAHA
jgi:lysophospholipase L1-like esterase